MPLNINGTTGISGVDGSASAPALTGTDSNTGINFGSDILGFNTGGVERSRFDSNGNLLIGSTSYNAGAFGGNARGINVAGIQPQVLLHETDTDKDGYLGIANSEMRLTTADSIPITFATADVERMRIDSSGVLQTLNSPYSYLSSNSTSNSSLTIKKTVSGAESIDYLQCRDSSNNLKMGVQGNGNVINTNNSYGSVSDVNLKENIVDANSQWDDIKALKVRNFNFKDDTKKTKMLGVVAQEIEIVSAGLVSESIDRDPDTNEDLGTTTKSVKYSILYMKAIKALQEAQARIETLETKVAALEGG